MTGGGSSQFVAVSSEQVSGASGALKGQIADTND